ncbi:hypothetical protein FQA39_LY11271 [Lamprigera yunnana]|nr:hypothetical protein FQA39_LY11271 [Lamprigera yunnana]
MSIKLNPFTKIKPECIMDPKTLYECKVFERLEQAVDDIEQDDSEEVIDSCVLPPNFDNITDDEDCDDDVIADANFIPQDIHGTIEITIDNSADDQASRIFGKRIFRISKAKIDEVSSALYTYKYFY